MAHGEEVFGELLAAAPLATPLARVSLVKKDEGCAGLLEEPLDKLDAEPRQAVSVGHHNFFDQACLAVSQKPREAFAFEVGARGDVLVDVVARVSVLERLDLPLEVIFLLAGRDAAVEGPLGRLRGLVGREIAVRGGGVLHTTDVEAPLCPRGEFEAAPGLVRPGSEDGELKNAEDFGGLFGRKKSVIFMPTHAKSSCLRLCT